MCKKIWIEFSGCKTMCALSQHEKQPYSCYFCFSIYGCNVLPFFSLYFLVECWNSIYTKFKQKAPDSELIELIWGCFVLRRKWGLNQYRGLWAVDKLEADLGLGKLCALLCLHPTLARLFGTWPGWGPRSPPPPQSASCKSWSLTAAWLQKMS